MACPTSNRNEISVPADIKNLAASRKAKRLRISLNQWAMIHAVIEHGGFANAAEYLHLSQSAISYSVAKMQAQLGVSIFKIEGRKAQITAEGLDLLTRSRELLRAAFDLEQYASDLQRGGAVTLKLAVDEHFPTPLLMNGIRAFSASNKKVRINILEASAREIEKLVTDQLVDLAISGYVPFGFMAETLLEIEYVPVAHPDHALFHLNREIMPADLENEVQITLPKAENYALPIDPPESAPRIRRWEVKSFDTAVSALCQCLGYGWLPRHRIQKSLERGKLKIVPMRGRPVHKAALHLIQGRSLTAAPEVSQLVTALCEMSLGFDRAGV